MNSYGQYNANTIDCKFQNKNEFQHQNDSKNEFHSILFDNFSKMLHPLLLSTFDLFCLLQNFYFSYQIVVSFEAAETSSSSILIGPFLPEVLSPPILEFSKLLNAVPLRMRIVHSISAPAFSTHTLYNIYIIGISKQNSVFLTNNSGLIPVQLLYQ